jgi:D-lactate dehydrogenase
MRILFDKTEPAEQALYREMLTGHELVFLDSPIRAVVPELATADILSVFVSSSVTKEMIAAAPALKCVVARSMGFDHIDRAACKERGIVVSYVPSYGTRTVAEFAFALLLALSRKAYAAYDRLRTDGTTDVKDFEGFDLAEKTIGVVGTGKIGKNMARIARGFDMTVILCDAYPDEAFSKEIGSSYCALEDLVSRCDVVSVHVPLMPQTQHLINADVLAKFKKGAYLINTSRGGIVDTRALVDALKNGQLGGAGLDVIEGERALMDETSLLSDEHKDVKEFQELVAAHALLDMPNVILTPHIAFNTREAKREIAETAAKDILAFVNGAPVNAIPA